MDHIIGNIAEASTMNLPFSIEQFFEVFEKYNLYIWPFHIFVYLLAVVVLVLLFKQRRYSHKAINGVLAFFWIWMGVVYHILFFSEINTAAYIFGSLFIFQGLLFVWSGVLKDTLSYRVTWNFYNIVGFLMILYGMVVYPLLGNAFGHVYPAKPMFGVAPCPSVIFTFGILLMSRTKIPWSILIIPLIWSIIGFSAAVKLSVPEDYGLFVSGVLMVILNVFRKKS